jgi:hypothetical protein
MASLNDILSALQNGVQAINALTKQLSNSFPPITTLTTAAPAAGVITYSSSLVSAFGLVETSSGGTYRIALLPST